jgi:hypothetical protein
VSLTYLVPMAGACARAKLPSLFSPAYRCGCAGCLKAEHVHVSWRIERMRVLLGTDLKMVFYEPIAVMPGDPPEGEEERIARHARVGQPTEAPFRVVDPTA